MRTMIMRVFCSGMAALLAANFGCRSTNDGGKTPEKTTVSVTTPEPLERSTTQPARIEAWEETPLYAKISGYVDKLHKDIGDRVKKGELLVTLWVPEMQDELKQLEAQIELAKAEQKQAAAAIETADAGRTRAEGVHKRWKKELQRITALAKSEVFEEKLKDETQEQFSAAEAAKQEAEAKIKAASADKEVADARLKVAERKHDHMKTLLNYAEIKAPYDGVVVRRNVDTRDFVQPGDTGQSNPLFVVAHVDTLRIFLDVPEAEASFISCENGASQGVSAGGVRTGAQTMPVSEATIVVHALGGRKITANVTRSSWVLNPANRSLRVEIDVPNKNGLLRPGMYASVKIVYGRPKGAFTLPLSAIFDKDGAPHCCCVEHGKIVHKKVTLGSRIGNNIEITAGLDGSEQVVRANAGLLKKGQEVRIEGS